jgi:tetratricopeptide (TPR) repeat protein
MAARHLAALVWLGTALACAGALAPGGVQPESAPALEQELSQHPGDPGLELRLAKAYYADGRFDNARQALAVVLAANPTNAEARAYLGLTYEGLVRYDSARTVYIELLASKVDRHVRQLLSGRLVLLTRKELQLAAKQAIARESELAHRSPDPNTVAVMPFRYTGTDTTLRPLERAIAAVVVTDLAQVHQLKLVERTRVQALLDELALADSGLVDRASGARSGRLVGAGEVVQGQFGTGPANALRIDATVVRATDAQVQAVGSNADELRALFAIEKAVVFQLLERLGITLTPEEQVAISERPTQNLAAFLLYGRGLEAEDRGDFTAAAQAFQQAAHLDPGFRAAAQQAAASGAAQAAAAGPMTDLAGAVNGGTPGGAGTGSTGAATLLGAINGAVPTGASALASVVASSTISLPQSDPNRIAEGSSTDGPARAALVGHIVILIPRP